MPQLTIQIVGRNGAHHLARAVEVLRKIPKEEVALRYIDNGSTDDSVAVVREALPEADIIEREVNTGYAGGHNFGFSLCTTPYVLVHDQDVEIKWEGIQKLLEVFQDPKVGAVQGKLYRADPLPHRESNQVPLPVRKLDSAGIRQTLSLNGVDRGAHKEDQGQFEEPAEILAPSGACAVYRVTALKTAATPGESARLEIFDEDFFAYKEDVDLGWRLHQAGWKVMYQPVVMGYHARTLGKRGFGGWGLKPRTIFERLRSPRTRLSLRNYCWMIAKNVSVGQLILHSPFIAARLLVFLVLSLLNPPLFSVWRETVAGIPRMLAKRP